MKFKGSTDFDKDFSAFCLNFNRDENYILWGAGRTSERYINHSNILEYLHLKIKFIIDSDPKKAGGKLGEYSIYPPDILKSEPNVRVIIVPSGDMGNTIAEELKKLGYHDDDFCQLYDLLVCWYWNYFHEIFAPMVAIHITTKCSLACKGCLQLVPLMKDRYHMQLNDVQKDIDRLFSVVDMVGDVLFSSGEPFLYPLFDEVIDYIYAHYKEKFCFCIINTNGTIIPSEKVLSSLQQDNLTVLISDYSHEILNSEKLEQLVKLLKDKGIQGSLQSMFCSGKNEEWVDVGDPFKSRERSISALKRVYTRCSDYCKHLRHGCLFYCAPQAGAIFGGICKKPCDSDYLDLSNASKFDLVKFFLQYNKKGYLEFCDYCDGIGHAVNKNPLVPAGEQVK